MAGSACVLTRSCLTESLSLMEQALKSRPFACVMRITV